LTSQMSSSVLVFMIIGSDDIPVYEADLLASQSREQPAQYLHHFVLHAALDAVDDVMWTSKDCHLKTVDRFNQLIVSAYVTPGSSTARFLLLHDGRNDDTIKAFFTEVYELYLKAILNPFQSPGSKVVSRVFDAKVRALSKKLQ
jgi:hypothetical protein